MNKIKKITLTASVLAVAATIAVSASSAGTATDPLVTLSYLTGSFRTELIDSIVTLFNDSYLDEIRQDVCTDAVAAVESDIENGNVEIPMESNSYQVVHLFKGEYISSTGSCEIILRSGGAFCFVTSQENIDSGVGLSDVTGGTEITNNSAIPQNHLLIIPRADGRGVTVTSDEAYFMVRGDYKVN